MANGVISKRGNHSRNRLFPNCRGRRPDQFKSRVEEALERQNYWTGLSAEQKIAELDRRLGKNVGAMKQRQKINNGGSKKVTAPVLSAITEKPTEDVIVISEGKRNISSFADLQGSKVSDQSSEEAIKVLDAAAPSKKRKNKKQSS